MAFVVEQKPTGSSQFALMDEGSNEAVVSEVKDLGMVPVNPTFLAANKAKAEKEGKDPNRVKTEERKCRIIYKAADGTEAAETLTVSLHERANLAKRVKAITGEAPGTKFDLDSMVGLPVTVQIEHYIKTNGYDGAKVMGVFGRKKAKKAAAPAAKPNIHGVVIDDSELGF